MNNRYYSNNFFVRNIKKKRFKVLLYINFSIFPYDIKSFNILNNLIQLGPLDWIRCQARELSVDWIECQGSTNSIQFPAQSIIWAVSLCAVWNMLCADGWIELNWIELIDLRPCCSLICEPSGRQDKACKSMIPLYLSIGVWLKQNRLFRVLT